MHRRRFSLANKGEIRPLNEAAAAADRVGVMDIKDSESYLLLRNGLLTLVSSMLLLLKDLLDGAAEIVFSIHAKIGGAQAGSSVADCSERAQKAENGLELTGSGNDLRFKEPRIQKQSSVKQTESVGTSGSEDMHKYCRGCQRAKLSVESSTRDVPKTSGSEEYYNPPCEIHVSESDISGDDCPCESTSWTSYEREKNSRSNSGCSSQASFCGDYDTEGYSRQQKPWFQHRQQPRDVSVGSTSTRKMRPRRVCAPSGRNIPGKKFGQWKNFKEIFSTILHHHHHRHHNYTRNHTDGDGDDDYLRGSEKRKAYGKLPTKHSAITSQFLKPYAYGRHALKKIMGGSKKVQKPVRYLIGGLFKHNRHAKRPKLLRRFGKNKTPAKLNRLNLLRRYKKANKLKIGYRKKNNFSDLLSNN